MAITIDATSSKTDGLATSTSWSHTVGTSKKDCVLFVALGSGTATAPISGVTITYGGQTMTNCADISDGTHDLRSLIYYLVNPPTGSNTVSISWTTSAYVSCGAVSLYGVSRGLPVLGSAITQTATTGSVSLTIPISGGCWAIDAVSTAVGDAGLTVGAGQTELVNSSTFRGAASYEGYTDGASSIDMTWTKAVGRNSIACGVAINPSSGRGNTMVAPFMKI